MVRFLRTVYPVYVFVDLILIGISFYAAYILKYNKPDTVFISLNLPNLKEYSFVFFLWVLFILISFRIKNLYTTDRTLNIPRETYRVSINILYSTVITAAAVFFLQYKFFSRLLFLEIFILLCALLNSWRITKRLILRKLIMAGFHNINVLIVGADKQGAIILDEIKRAPYYGLKVVGFLDENDKGYFNGIPVLGTHKDLPVVIRKYFIDEIIVTALAKERVFRELVNAVKKMHLGLRFILDNYEDYLPEIKVSHLGIVPLITYKERKHHPTEFVLKRAFDFIFSLFLLAVLSPLFFIVALLIKIDSRGHVFYIQERVGYKGRRFSFYKFRSMVNDADKLKEHLLENNEVKDGILFKIKKDPRITKLGLFIRKHSLDELPQLFNVIIGDMSLVGPRPPTPDEVEKYNYMQMQRLSIRPGITCLSQVRGRSELTFRKWVKWDSWYIANWSFILDLRIIWWTILVVLKGEGAY